MTFDTVIRDGTVVDGSGRPRFEADVGIVGGTIAAVGDLGGAEAAQTVDAAGRVVAPGFVDMHSHSDVSMLDDPGAESKAFQGVTTEVTGNCSYTPYPAGAAGVEALRQAMGATLRSRAPWTWSTLDGWAEATEAAGVGLNIAPLVGHGALRVAAGVTDDRPPTDDELAEMRRLAADVDGAGRVRPVHRPDPRALDVRRDGRARLAGRGDRALPGRVLRDPRPRLGRLARQVARGGRRDRPPRRRARGVLAHRHRRPAGCTATASGWSR